MIRWLHISDLHLGNDDMMSSRMRDKLLSFLTEKIGKVDYVFLTGDIRSANMPDNHFTEDMADFLKDICKHSGIGTDRLFIVAGNHDINRDVPGRHKAIKKVKFGWKGYYDPNSGKIKDEDLTVIWKGQEDLRNFLKYVYDLKQLSRYDNFKAPHFIIETDDFNIIHLDTTIIYTKNQEAHDLIVGNKYLYETLKTINKKKPSILLTHYPITSLLQDERKFVSEILRDYNIRLWLCGHEHDQNLQPYKYLHMLQSGEVQYEKNGRASFLVGEYNPDTFKCNVNAHAWFPEGWAKYPFVDRDGERQDTYKFELKPLDSDCVPALTKKARKANESSLVRLPKNLNKDLFPVIDTDGKIAVVKTILKDNWNTDSPNIILLGQAGMGKSTMLLDYCQTSTKPTIYISAERLQAMGWTMEQYCVSTLFDGDMHEFQTSLTKKYEEPSLIIVLDGLNEVDADCERKLIHEVQRFSLLKGVQILIASRVDFTVRFNLYGYRKAIVRDLEDKVLQSVFTPDEWSKICHSGNLHRLLRNPMLLTIYRETCNVMDESRDIAFLDWIIPVETSSDLFHNHYLAQIALMMRRDSVDGTQILKAVECIDKILPAIAYNYEISYSISKSNPDFRKILSVTLDEISFAEYTRTDAIRDKYRVRQEIKLSAGEVCDLLIEELHLIHQDDKATSFHHQMYRDYLSACHIINSSTNIETISQIWNSRIIPKPVSIHITNCSGVYWEGIAKNIKKSAESDTEKRYQIINIFHCFLKSKEKGAMDYSQLHLGDLLLPDWDSDGEKTSLENSTINTLTLGLNQNYQEPFHVLAFSDDGQFLAGSSGKSITIFYLKSDKRPFKYSIGKNATQLRFYDNYLLINAGSLLVFSYKDRWRYIGEIKVESGGIFNSNFRALKGVKDSLYIYYKNRFLIYNLSDCKQIRLEHVTYSTENIVEGYDLYDLRHSGDRYKRLSAPNGIVSEASCESMTAISYPDGSLELYNEEEPVATLVEASYILLDAAISGDGSRAATLSFKVFKNGRRVQLWDINNDIKGGEIYCTPEITKLHLSENGDWILGVSENGTWVYNIESKQEKWIYDEIISNQYNKLISYSDKILQKDSDGKLQLFALDNWQKTPLKSPVKNPNIVCMLKNDSIAAIDYLGYDLCFYSERDGHFIKNQDNYNQFIALQAFSSHPFIAAASKSRVSIYHTGTGQRTRKLDVKNCDIRFMVCHPTKTIVAYTDGNRSINIASFEEVQHYEGPRGWWFPHEYINLSKSKILDMAFNERKKALIVIMTDGSILQLSNDKCKEKSKSQIITAFSTYAYDFHGVICTPEIETILRQNDCL